MPHPHLVFLIGMPAAGKTHWGEKLAAEYGWQFVDLDMLIAAQEKASISALFASYGENGFREREHKQLKKLITAASEHTVIACGGGTPCFAGNMKLMLDAGPVIYLRAEVPELIANLSSGDDVRPLLKGRGDMVAYLEGMLAQRKFFYEQAQYILQTKDISITTFAQIISSCTNRQ